MIALGGVATGSIKAKLHPIDAPRTGGMGLIEDAVEMAIMIGIIILADAVLEVSSVKNTLNATDRRVMSVKLAESPPMEMKNFPMESAKPVSNIWNPMESPPPNRRSVPQSIRNASLKERVNWPCLSFTGRKKSKPAPIMAARDSGK